MCVSFDVHVFICHVIVVCVCLVSCDRLVKELKMQSTRMETRLSSLFRVSVNVCLCVCVIIRIVVMNNLGSINYDIVMETKFCVLF